MAAQAEIPALADTGGNNSGHSNRAVPTKITPELVREVADRVFSLLLRDIKIERERMRSQIFMSRR